MSAPDVVFLSGLSGSGKTTAMAALEDLGFYCVDNLPAALLPEFVRLISKRDDREYARVALGVDARSPGQELGEIPAWLDGLAESGMNCQLLFLTADSRSIIKRFSETRRRHPLTGSDQVLSDAIDNEQALLEPLHRHADLVINTSRTNIHQLRRQVWKFTDARAGGLTIVLQSFAFKAGVPQDVDFLFDARILPNPYWEEELREMTGRDDAVRSWLEQDDDVLQMTHDIQSFMGNWLPAFQDSQRSYVTIGIGCTGGRHRSVYLAEKLAESLRAGIGNVLVHHREISS